MKFTINTVIIRKLFALSLFLIFTACKVSKDLPLITSELPVSFPYKTELDSLTIADLPWKSFFSDQKLQVLIDSTLKNNFDMGIAIKNLEQTQTILKQSRWNLIPILELKLSASTNNPSNYSLNGQKTSDLSGSNHIEDYNATILLSWEADIWGKIKQTNKVALAGYLQSEESKRVLQTQLIAHVAKSYFNLIMLDEQLRIAKHNISLNNSSLQSIEALYIVGQVTDFAVQQVQALQLQALAMVPTIEQEIRLQENALHLLSGQLPGTQQERSKLMDINFTSEFSTGLPSTMLRHRPDIRHDELELTIANAKVGIQKAQLYPSLRITATSGVNALKASDWFNIPSALFGMVAGSVVQPLFQHKQLKTQYELAKQDREKSVIRFRQTVLNAFTEVTDALTKIDKLEQQEQLSVQRVSTLQQASAKSNALFLGGMVNYLEVLTAQKSTLESELDLAFIRCQRLYAITDLYRSLGGGVF